MKSVRLALLLAAAVSFAVAPSFAFHMGGVAECGGCHSMHSSPQTVGSLLVATDQSSTCLTCHEGSQGSYHISTPETSMPEGTAPFQYTPGGDFGWLKKTYTYVLRGSTITEEGERHGHNIIALDFGYYTDTTNATGPGGTYPSAQLTCISCHDPHGRSRRLANGNVVTPGVNGVTNTLPIGSSGSYNNSPDPSATFAVGTYRILAGPGYLTDGVTFDGAPAAVVPSTYNRTELTTQTRAAYGSVAGNGHVKWGTWCGECHTAMNNGMSLRNGEVHPVDEALDTDLSNFYNQYRGSGDLSGTSVNSFLSLVPYAETNAGGASALYDALQAKALNNNANLNGPTLNDEVTCLSCHRAHASGFVDAVRWNMEGELIAVAGVWPGSNAATVVGAATQPNDVKWAQGRTQEETAAAYNNHPASQFADYQRVLCNKCHAKD